MIVALVIVVAIIAAFVIVYLGPGSLSVTTATTFVAAGQPVSFTASINTPPLVSAGPVSWQFGDKGTAPNGGTSVSHSYDTPGNFLVAASSTLSNGKVVDNSNGLFQVRVGTPVGVTPALGTTLTYGVIAINTTVSSTGAPLIAPGGTIAIAAGVQQPPSFEYDTLAIPANNTWVNYTWSVASLVVDWGDGSTPQTNSSGDTYTAQHTYASAGIFSLTLQVNTQNYSATQYDGVPTSPTPQPVPGSTASTKVGQTIAVGSYNIVTFSVVNPGIIVNMEAVTGGYFTLDPALDYESTGFEIIANVYQTLLSYNLTSTDQFVPTIADRLPTVANGQISADYKNYTFHIRQGMKFSNGDPITPWDVKYSVTRTMLFDSGSPFPPGWIISQYLVPGTFVPTWSPPDSFGIDATMFDMLNNAITVDNSTQTVTFHLQVAAPPLLFYQVVADPLGTGIVDHLWLESGNNPKLQWTPKGFTDYENYSFAANYVNAWRNGAVGSGPYKIDFVSNPNEVALVANPNFQPMPPALPAPSVNRVVLQWISSDTTRELSLQSGKADIAGIVTSHFGVAESMVGQHLVNTIFFPTLNLFWWNFNLNVYQAGPSSPLQNDIPANFFVDMNMRKAFFYAFDFDQYLNSIVGNAKFGVTFAAKYGGIIPKGMIGYQDLSAADTFDMNLARQYFQATKWYKDHTSNPGFKLSINVDPADTVDTTAALAWAANLQSLASAGQIQISVVPVSFHDEIGYSIPWNNPMAVYYLGWLPDYPFPTDYTLPMLYPSTGPIGAIAGANGGTYPNANNFNIPYLAADANGTNQVANATLIRAWIDDSIGPNATNLNQVIIDSQKAQMMAQNMTLYVPTQQQYAYFVYRTWIGGMQLESNPTLGGADLLYNLLTKQTTSTAQVTTSSADAAMPGLYLAFASPLATIAIIGASESRVRERRR